jgi:hypothetical protein
MTYKHEDKAVQATREWAAYRQRVSRGKAREKLSRTCVNELPTENKDLVSKGEIHEATRGFVAMIKKAAKAGDEKDWRTSHQRRVVAFQHFKLLLTQSNLPALMNMTPDEIIELIRTI